uniref:Acyl-CoA thioesterase n=1 Tax=Haemonchus placei TaxID=6290 RepID=A0A0N4W9Q4_HAEPC
LKRNTVPVKFALQAKRMKFGWSVVRARTNAENHVRVHECASLLDVSV